MTRTRLQITVAIVILGIIAMYALYRGQNEVTTGCTGGIIALGMKLLEHTPVTPGSSNGKETLGTSKPVVDAKTSISLPSS